MREYLDLEFRDIEDTLAFDYSLERVIDDFILLAVFVGNDFLPNLPDLHIHENGLERLFDVYKKVLPSLGKSRTSFFRTSAHSSRWLHKRGRGHQYQATADRPGRNDYMGARDFRERIRGFELVQGKAEQTRPRNGTCAQAC
jgi:hypothetical protein